MICNSNCEQIKFDYKKVYLFAILNYHPIPHFQMVMIWNEFCEKKMIKLEQALSFDLSRDFQFLYSYDLE